MFGKTLHGQSYQFGEIKIFIIYCNEIWQQFKQILPMHSGFIMQWQIKNYIYAATHGVQTHAGTPSPEMFLPFVTL